MGRDALKKYSETDHDLLVEIRSKIIDDGGLMQRVGRIEDALVGTINGQLGLIPQFKQHREEHARERNRIIAVFTVVATGVGTLVSWVLDFLFHR